MKASPNPSPTRNPRHSESPTTAIVAPATATGAR